LGHSPMLVGCGASDPNRDRVKRKAENLKPVASSKRIPALLPPLSYDKVMLHTKAGFVMNT